MGVFILGGGRGWQGNKLGPTANKHMQRLCIQCLPAETQRASLQHPRFRQHPKICSHPRHGSWGCSPSSLPCRSTNVATNTCCSALGQVQQGHQHPQMHEVLILTSLLAGDDRGGRCCGGNREGSSLVGEVFTAFLPDLPVLSPQHTPFFPEEISYPATPLPHFQTVHHRGAQQPVPWPQARASPSSPFLETHSWASPSSPTPPQLPVLAATMSTEGLFCQLNCF